MYDIVIKHGTVVDGTGTPRSIADVAIEKGVIKKIGNLEGAAARTTLDAPNLIVAPGFIDVGNHADTYLTLFTNPSLESLLRQGITTIIGGNCGTSLAPLVEPNAVSPIQKWASLDEININWHTLQEYFSALTKKGLPLNVGTLVGHETLVRGSRKEGGRKLTPQELRQACTLLRKSLREGAFGLSTGFEFLGNYSAAYESLIPLIAVVQEEKGIHAVHLQNERAKFLGSLNDALRVAKTTGVHTHISHFKVHHPHWEWFARGLEMIDHARASGGAITFDMYPYLVSATHLAVFLPEQFHEKPFATILESLKDKKTRDALLARIAEDRYTLRSITIASLETAPNLVGKTIETIAHEFNESEEEAFLHILEMGDGNVIGFIPSLSRDNLRMGYSHAASFVASNGAGHDLRSLPKNTLLHPRAWGAFPKFFHDFYYTRELIPLEEAVRKMTGLPAEIFGISRRGLIQEGYAADIVILNPHEFQDRYRFGDQPRYATGVEHLFINGIPVISKENLVHTQAGMPVRKN